MSVMRVLLAVDDSAHSAAAVDAILTRPWPEGSIVRVITVVVLQPVAIEPWDALATFQAFEAEAKHRAETFVDGVVARLRSNGLSADAVVRAGEPRIAVIDEAISWAADLIVLGSHGRAGLRRLLLGSVASYVVSHAPCSVEVVRRR